MNKRYKGDSNHDSLIAVYDTLGSIFILWSSLDFEGVAELGVGHRRRLFGGRLPTAVHVKVVANSNPLCIYLPLKHLTYGGEHMHIIVWFS